MVFSEKKTIILKKDNRQKRRKLKIEQIQYNHSSFYDKLKNNLKNRTSAEKVKDG